MLANWIFGVLFAGSLSSILILQEYMRRKANLQLPNAEQISVAPFNESARFAYLWSGYRALTQYRKQRPHSLIPILYVCSWLLAPIGLVGMAFTT